jgi:hypothetical protein
VRDLPLCTVVAFPGEFGRNGQSIFLFVRSPYVLLVK